MSEAKRLTVFFDTKAGNHEDKVIVEGCDYEINEGGDLRIFPKYDYDATVLFAPKDKWCFIIPDSDLFNSHQYLIHPDLLSMDYRDVYIKRYGKDA